MTEGSGDIRSGLIEEPDENLEEFILEWAHHRDYLTAVWRVRVVYESNSGGLITAEGPLRRLYDGEWIELGDEMRDRVLIIDPGYSPHGDQYWRVQNEDGRLLGELRRIEVGRDV